MIVKQPYFSPFKPFIKVPMAYEYIFIYTSILWAFT